jgi:hypothetical protein
MKSSVCKVAILPHRSVPRSNDRRLAAQHPRQQAAGSGKERLPVGRRHLVSGRRRYDRHAMRGRPCIQHDDQAASRLAPEGGDDRFDL